MVKRVVSSLPPIQQSIPEDVPDYLPDDIATKLINHLQNLEYLQANARQGIYKDHTDSDKEVLVISAEYFEYIIKTYSALLYGLQMNQPKGLWPKVVGKIRVWFGRNAPDPRPR